MPKIIKMLLGLILFCIGPFLLVLIGPTILIIHDMREYFDPSTWTNRNYYERKKKKPNCCIKHIFCTQDRKCKFLGLLFVYFPMRLFFVRIALVLGAIIFGISIVPAYIFTLAVIIKIFCYWSKTKRLDNSKLSRE